MKRYLIILFSVISFCSCSTHKSLYSWYDYEDETYQYLKELSEEQQNKIRIEYAKICNDYNEKGKSIPPGISAEYGWLLYKAGDIKNAIIYLNNEIQIYPESRSYISKIISKIKE